MDVGRAFSFITEDEEWIKKILIGGLIMLIPIVGGLAIYGYMLETARNVARGNPRPLPDWTNFGDKLMKGLYAVLIQIVYFIPVIIIQCIVQFLSAGLASADSDGAAAAGGIILLCLVPVLLILSIVLGILVFAAYARYIQTDSLSAAFQFSEVIGMVRSSFKPWLMIILVSILAAIVAAAGMIACGVGVLFTSVFAYAAIGHALGQVVAGLNGGSTPGSDLNIPPTYGTPA
jgi:hypothetical protein